MIKFERILPYLGRMPVAVLFVPASETRSPPEHRLVHSVYAFGSHMRYQSFARLIAQHWCSVR